MSLNGVALDKDGFECFKIPFGLIKVSMLNNTYPHKPLRKTTVTICSPLYVRPDV